MHDCYILFQVDLRYQVVMINYNIRRVSVYMVINKSEAIHIHEIYTRKLLSIFRLVVFLWRWDLWMMEHGDPWWKPHPDLQQRETRVMHAKEPFYCVHGEVTWQSIMNSDTKHYLLLGLLTIDRRIRRRPVALRFQEGNLGCNCARQKHHVTRTRDTPSYHDPL